MKGPANPLNSSRREYRGLQYGPLVEASSRGAFVEWLSNELLTPPENMSADERRGLALMRQLLRRLRYENDDVRPTNPSVARRPRTAFSTSLPPRLSLAQCSAATSPPASPNPIPPRGRGLDPMRLTPTPPPPTPNRATTAPGVSSSTISLSEAARLELEAESQRRSSLPTGRRTSGVEVSESLSSSVKMPLAEETDEQLAHATADDGAGVGGGRPDDLSHLAAIAGAGPHDSITLTIEAPARGARAPQAAAAARAEDDGARPEVQPRPADRLSAV